MIDLEVTAAVAACRTAQFRTFSVRSDIARINEVFGHIGRDVVSGVNLFAGLCNALVGSGTAFVAVRIALHAFPAAFDIAAPRALTAIVFAVQQTFVFAGHFDAFAAGRRTRLTVGFQLVSRFAGGNACRISRRAGFGFAFVVRTALFTRAAIRIFGAATRFFHALMVHRRMACRACQRFAFAVFAGRVEIAVRIGRTASRNFGAGVVFGFLASAAGNGNASVVFALFVGSASAVGRTPAVNRRTGHASVVFRRSRSIARRTRRGITQFLASHFDAFARNDFVAVFAFRAGRFGTALFAIRIDGFAGDASSTA